MLYILYQLLPHYMNNNNQNNNNVPRTNNQTIEGENIVNHFESSVMPTTEHGFHDHFAKLNGYDNNQHLGWRYWYLRNKTDYRVKPTNNFNNIKNYLDGLENTNNWFENLSEMTDIEDFVIE